MSRNYGNFLDAYLEWARDDFVPDKFHLWTGLSIIAGALERKVWIRISEKANMYPNLYVLLVSNPGIGKSSAINPGVQLLREVSQHSKPGVKFIPSQVTEAKLIELMSEHNYFTYGSKQVKHCSGYYCASEASACLRDIYGGGNFVNMITSFYDCDPVWEKATVKLGDEKLVLTNVCFNLIAGSTFDYLRELVTEKNIMGGFASRLVYVIQKDVLDRVSYWQSRGKAKQSRISRENLLSDLYDIHKIVGPYKANEEFAQCWDKWFPVQDRQRQKIKSESLQALLARKTDMIQKLCMVLSAAESNDRILKKHHWEKAMALVTGVEKELPDMLRSGKAKDTRSQDGMNQMLLRTLANGAGGRMSVSEAQSKAMFAGFDRAIVANTFKTLAEAKDTGPIKLEGGEIFLVGNPDDYL